MSKIEQQLREQGFTNDQITEINEGIKAGLDVSIYARKEFLAIQMRQIRLGLAQGLDVKKYASEEYDWFQMEEIRKGLLGGLEVESYAFPDISYDKMRQIRWGLCDGFDLSPFKHLDAGILKELRLALKSRISIVPYINAGYDAEQLEAIRVALEKGLDIAPYLKKDYRGISLQEICIGLEHGLDVSVYAKTDYCWQQMREIRLGLEHMLDVSPYSNGYYSWQQMREIRLGLEEGLDVSYFNSFIYTAADMEQRRLALQENPAIAYAKVEHARPKSDVSEHCQIEISKDQTAAYLEIIGDMRGISRMEILKALRSMGITYGIQYDKIDQIVSGNSFRKNILIAKGVPVRHGADGWYEYFFRTEVARTPKELADGNIDYRNVEWFETVVVGQKLAYYHPALSGENGTTVTGESIPARKGKEQSILTGTGFQRLADGRTYIAMMQGIVTIQETYLNVSNLLVMEEVNLTTGDVDFDGNVLVQGNVGCGAKIRATGDVVVQGFVEAAQIFCGGNVFLQQGMNGAGSGYIHADNDVIGYFFEAAEVDAYGNIQGDYFLNCRMHAQGNVNVTGKKGTLVGGFVFAEKGLKAYELGNQAGLSTTVKLGMVERLTQREKEIDNLIHNVSMELYTLSNSHHEFQIKYPPEVRNTMPIYLKIESAVYTKEKEMEELMQDKNQLQEYKQHVKEVSAVITGRLYDGVTFEIDGVQWRSRDVIGVVIKRSGNRIISCSN